MLGPSGANSSIIVQRIAIFVLVYYKTVGNSGYRNLSKRGCRNVEMMVSISSLRRGSCLVQLTIRVWSTGHLAPTESSVEGREAGLGNCSVSSSPVSTPKLYTSIFVV